MKARCVICSLLAATLAYIYSFSAFGQTSPIITLEVDETRTIELNGPINSFSAKDFIEDLKELDDGKPILIRISSPGGEIIAGIDMIKAIQDAKSPITCAVDRYAASMAAMLAVACPKLIMHKYSILMFHEYLADVSGSRKEIKSKLDFIESIWEAIMDETSRKTGIPRAELDAKFATDWWLNAKEASEAHLITSIVDHYKVVKKKSRFGQVIHMLFGKRDPV